MLLGISPLLSPNLLFTLYCMGHGDEIVIADANFPGSALNKDIIRADGLEIAPLLKAILPLFPLDNNPQGPVIMMSPSDGDIVDPQVEQSYSEVILSQWPETQPFMKLERFEFYERAKKSFAILMTGETKIYANIILRKGVVKVKN